MAVCSSMVRNDSLDYPLLVPNGSYIYTANGCVRCKCDAANNWMWVPIIVLSKYTTWAPKDVDNKIPESLIYTL